MDRRQNSVVSLTGVAMKTSRRNANVGDVFFGVRKLDER